MDFRILIIDDDDLVSASLKRVLVKLNYQVEVCLNAAEAEEKILAFEPDIILLDIYLTTHNGLDLLKEFQKKFFGIPVIMITGYSDVNMAVSAIKAGAFDFLLKPIDLEQLKLVLGKAADNLFLRTEVDKLHAILKSDTIVPGFFGVSKKIQKLVGSVEKLSKSADTTILIEGESGTGKEEFAKFIHQNSPRKEKSFIQINCSAIPKELAESELFGHERGAFTGAAQKTKLGKFELAEGGTILLDEIGELTLDLQVKLLRALQERKFYRLGGEKEISVNVRVLAATNRNLEEEVKKGTFREDLYYRLNVAKINVPALRERTEDIPILAYSFLKEFEKKFAKEIKGFDASALELLKSYPWKGNIRELRNVIERVVLLTDEKEIKEKDFHFLADNAKEQRTTQIFVNLIDNAIKYTNSGFVKISLYNEPGKAIVEVSDSGIGISENFLPNVFNPFAQEDSSQTRPYEGTGLGLALVKKYVDINKASISIESIKGSGTKFKVVFDLHENHQA